MRIRCVSDRGWQQRWQQRQQPPANSSDRRQRITPARSASTWDISGLKSRRSRVRPTWLRAPPSVRISHRFLTDWPDDTGLWRHAGHRV